MEEKALDALTLLNRNLTGVVAQTAPLGQPPKRGARRAQSKHGRGRNCNFGRTTTQARPATGSAAPTLSRDLHNKSNESRKSEVPTAALPDKSVNFQDYADSSVPSQPQTTQKKGKHGKDRPRLIPPSRGQFVQTTDAIKMSPRDFLRIGKVQKE